MCFSKHLGTSAVVICRHQTLGYWSLQLSPVIQKLIKMMWLGAWDIKPFRTGKKPFRMKTSILFQSMPTNCTKENGDNCFWSALEFLLNLSCTQTWDIIDESKILTDFILCRPLAKTVTFNVLKVIPAGSTSGGGKKVFAAVWRISCIFGCQQTGRS